MLKGKPQQAVGPPEAELLAEINPVVLDSAVTNEELCADILAGLTFGDHMQNPALRSRQTFESRFIFQQSLRSVAAIQKVRNKWVAYVKLPRGKGVDGFGVLNEG